MRAFALAGRAGGRFVVTCLLVGSALAAGASDTAQAQSRERRLRGRHTGGDPFANKWNSFTARDRRRDVVDGGRGRDEGRVDLGVDRLRSLERRS